MHVKKKACGAAVAILVNDLLRQNFHGSEYISLRGERLGAPSTKVAGVRSLGGHLRVMDELFAICRRSPGVLEWGSIRDTWHRAPPA